MKPSIECADLLNLIRCIVILLILLYCCFFGWTANMALGMSSNQRVSILNKAVESSVRNTWSWFLVYHTVTTEPNWIYLDSIP